MPKLDMTRDALKFVRDLDAKRYRRVVGKTLGLLTEPMPNDSESLKGSDKRRCGIGEFRTIDSLEGDTVKVAPIARRNDDRAYRGLKRKE